MINPKELRIGNIIYCVTNKLNVTVQWPHPAEVVINVQWPGGGGCEHVHAGLEECEPIPLTSEWLERCGFLQMQYKYYDGSTTEAFVFKGMRYIIRQIEFKGVEPYYAMEYFPYAQSHNCIPSELRYVHQLQNLYFTLTGEELEIKP